MKTHTLAAVAAALVLALAAAAAAQRPVSQVCDANGACGVNSVNPEAAQARASVVFDLEEPLSPPIPRISAEELEQPGNEAYRRREKPFILTGAIDDWPALKRWTISKDKVMRGEDYLSSMFAESVTDLYPYNMLRSGSHPFLSRFKRGLRNVLDEPGDYREPHSKYEYACKNGCRYIHLQLTPKDWERLEEVGDIPRKRHMHVKSDPWWMRRCLKDPAVREEYHIKTHWKIILIGTQSSGMFMHSDSLMSSSWHAHIQGNKLWMVCHPQRKHECMESVLKPGEILYYGSGWYHTTRNLEHPSMTVTGTVVTKENHQKLADKLHGECASGAMGFKFSSKLCDALDECYPLWSKVLTGKPAPAGRWRPWRQVSTADNIRTKEAIPPHQNNYDGSNYIAEN